MNYNTKSIPLIANINIYGIDFDIIVNDLNIKRLYMYVN